SLLTTWYRMDVLVPIKLPKVLRVSTPIHNGSNTFREDSARPGGRRPRWGADGLSETPRLRHQELRAVSDTSTTRGPSVTRTPQLAPCSQRAACSHRPRGQASKVPWRRLEWWAIL